MAYSAKIIGQIIDFANRQDIDAVATPKEWASLMKASFRRK